MWVDRVPPTRPVESARDAHRGEGPTLLTSLYSNFPREDTLDKWTTHVPGYPKPEADRVPSGRSGSQYQRASRLQKPKLSERDTIKGHGTQPLVLRSCDLPPTYHADYASSTLHCESSTRSPSHLQPEHRRSSNSAFQHLMADKHTRGSQHASHGSRPRESSASRQRRRASTLLEFDRVSQEPVSGEPFSTTGATLLPSLNGGADQQQFYRFPSQQGNTAMPTSVQHPVQFAKSSAEEWSQIARDPASSRSSATLASAKHFSIDEPAFLQPTPVHQPQWPARIAQGGTTAQKGTFQTFDETARNYRCMALEVLKVFIRCRRRLLTNAFLRIKSLPEGPKKSTAGQRMPAEQPWLKDWALSSSKHSSKGSFSQTCNPDRLTSSHADTSSRLSGGRTVSDRSDATFDASTTRSGAKMLQNRRATLGQSDVQCPPQRPGTLVGGSAEKNVNADKAFFLPQAMGATLLMHILASGVAIRHSGEKRTAFLTLRNAVLREHRQRRSETSPATTLKQPSHFEAFQIQRGCQCTEQGVLRVAFRKWRMIPPNSPRSLPRWSDIRPLVAEVTEFAQKHFTQNDASSFTPPTVTELHRMDQRAAVDNRISVFQNLRPLEPHNRTASVRAFCQSDATPDLETCYSPTSLSCPISLPLKALSHLTTGLLPHQESPPPTSSESNQKLLLPLIPEPHFSSPAQSTPRNFEPMSFGVHDSIPFSSTSSMAEALPSAKNNSLFSPKISQDPLVQTSIETTSSLQIPSPQQINKSAAPTREWLPQRRPAHMGNNDSCTQDATIPPVQSRSFISQPQRPATVERPIFERLCEGDFFVKFHRKNGKPSWRYVWIDFSEGCIRWAPSRPSLHRSNTSQTVVSNSVSRVEPINGSHNTANTEALKRKRSQSLSRFFRLSKTKSSEQPSGLPIQRSETRLSSTFFPNDIENYTQEMSQRPSITVSRHNSSMTPPSHRHPTLPSSSSFFSTHQLSSMAGSKRQYPSIPLRRVAKIAYTWIHSPATSVGVIRKNIEHLRTAGHLVEDLVSNGGDVRRAQATYSAQLPKAVYHRTFVLALLCNDDPNQSFTTSTTTPTRSRQLPLSRITNKLGKPSFLRTSPKNAPRNVEYLQLTCASDLQLYAWLTGLHTLMSSYYRVQFPSLHVSLNIRAPLSCVDLGSLSEDLLDDQSTADQSNSNSCRLVARLRWVKARRQIWALRTASE